MAGAADAAGPEPRAVAVWPDELRAGLAAAAAALPLVLALGLLAFGPLDAAAATFGLPASLTTAVLGAAAMAAISRAALPSAGPSSATALIFAAFVARVRVDDGAALLLLTGTLVAATGALLLLFGALRLGSLARFVPRPVLAGFMNGVAVLVVVAQWPALSTPLALAAGLATAALTLAVSRWRPRWPSALAGLAGGCLLVLAIEPWLAAPLLQAGAPLARVGSVVGTAGWPALPPWQQLPGATAALARHGADLALHALLLALIGGLESLLGLLAAESLHGRRSDANRELLALGGANLASGAFGGLPVVFLRAAATAAHGSGGRSWRATLTAAAVLALAFTWATPLLARLPLAVLAGTMLALAFALADRWTHQLAAQWLAGQRGGGTAQSLAIVAVVCAVTVAFGFVAGVGAGLLLALLLFARGMQRSLLRTRITADAAPSRRVYPQALETLLQPARRRIDLIELEGAFFFGNGQRLLDVAGRAVAQRRFVVIDLRRVTAIDASAAEALAQLDRELATQGATLLLAGSRHGAPYVDADHAIEHAEAALLREAGQAGFDAAVALERCAVFDGCTAAQLDTLRSLLRERSLRAGETLFREGDPGDALYVLTAGSVSMVGGSSGGQRQRFASLSPGMVFGELALLDGGGRSADAVADSDSRLHVLDAAALHALQATEPALAALLFRNLALHLSQRLRSASAAWRRAAG